MGVNKIILNGEEIELTDEQARRIIGSGTLETVAQTLIGGINELDTKVGDGILTTDNKALIGSVNEINEKISVINGNITDINQTITNIGSGTSGAIFKETGNSSVLLNRDINGKATYDFSFKLTSLVLGSQQLLNEGYVPFCLINSYAENGIIMPSITYRESDQQLTIELYNPYNDVRNTGTINYQFLFIKSDAYIQS